MVYVKLVSIIEEVIPKLNARISDHPKILFFFYCVILKILEIGHKH